MMVSRQLGSLGGRRSGSALLVVLSAIIVLSIVVVSFIEFSQSHLKEKAEEGLRFRARMLAESGLALGMHPEMEKGDPVLRQDFGDDTRFEVRLTKEGGRFPINSLTSEIEIEVLKRLFEAWEVPVDQATVAAESLADWTDVDADARNSGAEEEYYTGYGFDEYPLNQGFAAVDEMLLARGMDRIDRIKPNWREYFTVYGTGLIDVNAASVDVIRAALDLGKEEAIKIAAIRLGDDGRPDTEDDVDFSDLEEVKDNAGINDAEWSEISSLLTVEDTLERIESTGHVGSFRVKLIVLKDETSGIVARFER